MAEVVSENPYERPDVARQWIDLVEGFNLLRINQIEPVLARWINDLPEESTVTDVGCGQGNCSKMVPDSFGYVGIDSSELLIQRANELYGGQDRRFIVGRAEKLDLPDASANAAMMVHVLLYLADVSAPFHEVGRVLESGGQLMLTAAHPTNYDTWQNWFTDITEQDDKLVRGTLSRPYFQIEDCTIYLHRLDAVLAGLIDSGFSRRFSIHEMGPYMKPTGIAITATKQ